MLIVAFSVSRASARSLDESIQRLQEIVSFQAGSKELSTPEQRRDLASRIAEVCYEKLFKPLTDDENSTLDRELNSGDQAKVMAAGASQPVIRRHIRTPHSAVRPSA